MEEIMRIKALAFAIDELDPEARTSEGGEMLLYMLIDEIKDLRVE